MNKYLFLVDEVPPTRSANGICIDKVMKKLAERESVFCLCFNAESADPKNPYHCVALGQKHWMNVYADYKGRNDLTGRILFLLVRLYFRAKRFALSPIWPVESLKCAVAYYRRSCELIEQYGVNRVVAVCFPGETMLAAKWLKKKYGSRIKTFIFPLDVTLRGKWGGTSIEKRLSLFGGIQLLKNCAFSADALLVLENAESIYRDVFPSSQQCNFRLCGIPILEDKTSIAVDKEKRNYMELGYAGNLIYELRNPTYFLDLLEIACKERGEKAIFHLFGSADEKLNALWEGRYSNIRIEMHGWLTESQLDEQLCSMDVLLNVGNTQTHLIPSKLFKYMSLGKPIFHLAFSAADPCIPYLERYGQALIIEAWESGESPEKHTLVRNFLEQKHEPAVNICGLFPKCTPEYIAKIIMEE